MLNQPPVEKLTEIVGDKYKLTVLVSKRARASLASGHGTRRLQPTRTTPSR